MAGCIVAKKQQTFEDQIRVAQDAGNVGHI